MTDPIADMLTRIRNGLKAGHKTVALPFSKFKLKLANILEKENYIAGVKEFSYLGKPGLEITLKYTDAGEPAIKHIGRISSPGRRVYNKKDSLPNVLDGYGMAIISTPLGLLTNKEARKKGVGGEVICEID